MWAGRRVVLGVSGGIACYKSCTLARRLTEAGAQVDVVLTPGRRRVRPAAHVRGAHRAPRPELPLGAGRGALACPAGPAGRPRDRGAGHRAPHRPHGPGAGGRSAHRRCCSPRPRRVLLAPAMNDEMYAHPQTQANLERLRARGVGLRRARDRRARGGTVGAAGPHERAGDHPGARRAVRPRRRAGSPAAASW